MSTWVCDGKKNCVLSIKIKNEKFKHMLSYFILCSVLDIHSKRSHSERLIWQMNVSFFSVLLLLLLGSKLLWIIWHCVHWSLFNNNKKRVSLIVSCQYAEYWQVYKPMLRMAILFKRFSVRFFFFLNYRFRVKNPIFW